MKMDLLGALRLIRQGDRDFTRAWEVTDPRDVEVIRCMSCQSSVTMPSPSQQRTEHPLSQGPNSLQTFASSQTLISSQSVAYSQRKERQQLRHIYDKDYSARQNLLTPMDPPPSIERPPSCGQSPKEGDWIPSSAQMPSYHNDAYIPQDENTKSDPEQRPLAHNHGYQPSNSDNGDDSMDELTPGVYRAQLQSVEDWQNDNPDIRQSKLVPAKVPRSTGEVKTRFQHLCDEHRVTPTFDYKEVSSQSFHASLEVDGRRFKTPIPQPSKKLARDEVCKLALADIPLWENMNGIEGAGKKVQKRKSEDAGLEQPGVGKSDDSEDWISLVNLHGAQIKRGDPKWEYSMVEGNCQRFSSALTIPERPNEPFTSETFSTKKDAKAAAAKAAVVWLRNEGLLSEPPGKRRRKSPEGAMTDESDSARNSMKGMSLPERIHKLVMALGLKSPKWILRPSTLPSGQPLDSGNPFYDCYAKFDERDVLMEDSLRGLVSEVKNCLGQKKAKKICCEQIIPVLEEIKNRRLAPL